MKFHGKIGYGTTVETSPGVFDDTIVEHEHFGDVVRNMSSMQAGDTVDQNLSVSNTISMVADAYANEHFSNIRYVELAGVRWTVINVEIQRPRLILTLGGVYSGPAASAPVTP